MDPCPNLNQTYDGDDVFLSSSSLIVGKVLQTGFLGYFED